jgi:hypothetical protein
MWERNVTTEKNVTNNQDTGLTLHLHVYSETQYTGRDVFVSGA